MKKVSRRAVSFVLTLISALSVGLFVYPIASHSEDESDYTVTTTYKQIEEIKGVPSPEGTSGVIYADDTQEDASTDTVSIEEP
ncbi:MAG: hypothetical protein J5802_13460 [Butyrivibrio sp.]|nr:hypothetical protein [Butyrivibrio sp.]